LSECKSPFVSLYKGGVRACVKGFTTFEARAVFGRSFVSSYVFCGFNLNVCVHSSLVFGGLVRIFGYPPTPGTAVPCLTVLSCRRPSTGTTHCQTHIVGGHMRPNPSPTLSPSKVGSEDRHPLASHRRPCHCPSGCKPRPRRSEKPDHCLLHQ
jgi:hypothetical protein